MKNLNEIYPLQDQYGGGGGGGGGTPGHPPRFTGPQQTRTFGSMRGKGKVLLQIDQELNNLDDIEVFKTAAISALADRKATVEAPKQIEIKNTGQAGLGLVIQVPIWTDDHTQSGSNYLQLILGQNEELTLPTSRIIDSVDAEFNEGTTVTSFTAPSTDLYVATGSGCTDLDNTTDPVTFTTVGVRHRVSDLIRVENEVMEVTAISGDDVTVKRGLFGTTTASHTDGVDVRFAFFNKTRKFNNFSSVCTDASGIYSSSNFFGLGRSSTIANSGIVPGSASFTFYSSPYQEMGCTNLTEGSDSGLTSGEVYYIKVNVNSIGVYEVAFTVDSTKMGGSNGVLSKIQAILDAQYYTTGSNLNGKRVSVMLTGGDVRWVFHERKVGSVIALTAGTTGDTSHDLVANALGVFPASVEVATKTALPPETIYDSSSYQSRPNTASLLYDNGVGKLVGGAGSGSINYETGSVYIKAYPNADILYTVSHSSGLAGRASATKVNVVESIVAKSTNAKVDTKIKLTIRG